MTILIRIVAMISFAFLFHIIFNKINIHEKIVAKYKLDSFFRNTFFHIVIYFALSFAAIAIEYYVRSGKANPTYSDIMVGGLVIASMIKTIDIVNKNRENEKKSNKLKNKKKRKKRQK